MKFICALVCFVAAQAAAINPQLKQVNTIYILGMGNGMDQYLATQVTALGVFQVVTDPKKADAVITDRLGESFESKLKELYPPEPSKSKDGKVSSDTDISGSARVVAMGRGRGNFFIVDRKSGVVLWSIYEPPKDSTPGELTKVAHKIAQRLKSDLAEKKQTGE